MLARLELRVPPLLVGVLCAVVMHVGARSLPQFAIAVPWRPFAVAVPLGVGLAVALAGVLAFRRHRTTVNPLDPTATSTIVTTGIYRISRNPMYLGVLVVLAAWALYLGNLASAFLLPVAALYLDRFQIQPEERALHAKFGRTFAEYARRVRRWI